MSDHVGRTHPASSIPTLRVIEPDGSSSLDRSDLDLTDEQLLDLYRDMVRARVMDDLALALQADGELVVYPSSRGQEAAQIGSTAALAPTEMAFPTFRELPAAVTRGVPMSEYLAYHRGTWHGGPYDTIGHHFAPICITLATQTVHAAGYALGMKLRGTPAATLTYIGDGATSEGDFHEACNFAGVWELPLIMFVQNNHWAISVPGQHQYAAPLVDRAAGYGIRGVRVDGNDVLAVYLATREAAEIARTDGGATMIEALTYRMGAHHTADDPTRYRDASEHAAWEDEDPIDRYATYLHTTGILNDALDTEIRAAAANEAASVDVEVRALTAPPVEDVFEQSYVNTPQELFRQQAEISRFSGGRDERITLSDIRRKGS